MIRGYLRIRIRGRNSSRFFSLCAGRGIELSGLKSIGDNCYAANIRCRDFWNIAGIRRKTHVKLSVENRQGLVFAFRRLLRHRVFVILLIASLPAAVFLSGRLWHISITGLTTLGEDEIIRYLGEKSISCGMPVNAIDNAALELSLRQDFDEIIWVDVNEKGTKLSINIKEKIADSDKTEKSSGSEEYISLYASEDAVVESVVTRSGLSAVKAGDEVKAGDLLVSAAQEILNDDGEVGEIYYRNADADVMGYAAKEYEDWIEESCTDASQTGKKHTDFSVTVSELRFDLPALYAGFDEEESFCETVSPFPFVSFSRISTYEITKKSRIMTFSEAKELALLHFEQFLSDLEENGVRICDKNVMIEKIGKKYHIYGQVDVCENIAEQISVRKEITDELE